MQTDGTTFTAAHIQQWNPGAQHSARANPDIIDCDKEEILMTVPPSL